MTVKVEEEKKAEEATNTEEDTKADAPNSHANIATLMVAAHTSVLNASPKEPDTKTPPPLKTFREAAS